MKKRTAMIVAIVVYLTLCAGAFLTSCNSAQKPTLPSSGIFYSQPDAEGNGVILPLQNGKFDAISYHVEVTSDGTATLFHGNGDILRGLIAGEGYYGDNGVSGTLEATTDGFIATQQSAGGMPADFGDISGTYFADLDKALKAAGARYANRHWSFGFSEDLQDLPDDYFESLLDTVMSYSECYVPVLTKAAGTSQFDVETPYYTITLPSNAYTFTGVDDQTARTIPSIHPTRMAYNAQIEGPDGTVFVAAFTTDWGPEGWVSSADAGTCTIDANVHVAVFVSMDPTGESSAPSPEAAKKIADEFAAHVTVK